MQQVQNRLANKRSERETLHADKSGEALNGGPSETYDDVTYQMYRTQNNKDNLFDDLTSQINNRLDKNFGF